MPAAHPLPTLTDDDLTLRPSRPSDAPAVLDLLQDPEVAAWWGLDHTLASVADELGGAFTIELDGEIAGLLACHEETEPMYPSVAFDIALAASLHGRRLGRSTSAVARRRLLHLPRPPSLHDRSGRHQPDGDSLLPGRRVSGP